MNNVKCGKLSFDYDVGYNCKNIKYDGMDISYENFCYCKEKVKYICGTIIDNKFIDGYFCSSDGENFGSDMDGYFLAIEHEMYLYNNRKKECKFMSRK